LLAQNGDGNSFNSYSTDPYANIIPPTPNASTFNQYGKLQVNTSTGQPNISIPIYTIVEDGVKVPISLNYSATGIKVDDISSTVGLKWSLNAGGMISRTINDKDDFSTYTSHGWINGTNLSYFDEWLDDYSNFDYNSYDQQVNVLQPFLTLHDNWPDDFSYNFLTYSGGFMYNPDGTVLKEFRDKLEVSGNRNGFTINDMNGNSFEFGNDIETNKVDTRFYVQGETNINITNELEDVGWMLNEITTKNGKTITFEYDSYTYTYDRNPVSQRMVSSSNCSPTTCTFPLNCQDEGNSQLKNDKIHGTGLQQETTNQLLKRISTDKVEVEFIYTDGSANGHGVDGWDKRIDKIIITDLVKNYVREFHLGYDVFDGLYSRLKLTEVKEKGADGSFKPPYHFEYEDGSLPNPDSFSKDYKGYYNGQYNLSLLPKTASTLNRKRTTIIDPNSGPVVTYPGYDILSDRYFDENYIDIGVLKKVYYPTGGRSEFEYEVNAEGENISEPIIEKMGGAISTSFDDSQDPEAPAIYKTFSALFRFDETVGKLDLSNIIGCQVCGQEDFRVAKIYLYKYNGNVGEQIDWNKRFLPEVTYTSFDSPSLPLPTENGVYLVQLRVHTHFFPPYTSSDPFISVDLNWHQKKIDKNDNIIFQEHYYGGLRIKDIKDFDETETVYNHKSFNYLGSVHHFTSEIISSDFFKEIAGQDIFSTEVILLPGSQKKDGYYYSKVETIFKNTNKESKIVEEYEGIEGFKRIRGGYLKKRRVFDSDNHLMEAQSNKYIGYAHEEMLFMTPTLQNATVYEYYQCNAGNYLLRPVPAYSQPTQTNQYEYETSSKILDSTITIKKFNNKIIANVTTYQHNQNHLVTKETIDHRYGATLDANDNINLFMNDPDAEKISVDYEYPEDFPGEPTLTGVPASSVVSKKVYNNSLYILGEFWEFHNGNIKSLYRYNRGQGTHTGGPSYVDTGAEKIAKYIVNSDGNPIQITKVIGTPTAYIWGYNGQFPIAKIENSSYGSIDTNLRNDVIYESNSSNPNEQSLLNALNNLRNSLPDAKVTTFTYKPLNGITSVTDPKGNTQYFEYDEFGRLEWLKNDEKQMIKKHEYHYKSQ
tara:strand:- start:302357 stop:305653 length:3297 start_codon:yes stop_codon:yes gene_type:complete